MVGRGIDVLEAFTQIEGLPYEQPRQAQVRLILADLIGLAARKTCGAQSIVEAEAFIDFAIEPALGARPEPRPQIERGVRGLGAAVGRQTIAPGVGGVEPRCLLFDVGELRVHRPRLRIVTAVRRSRCRQPDGA